MLIWKRIVCFVWSAERRILRQYFLVCCIPIVCQVVLHAESLFFRTSTVKFYVCFNFPHTWNFTALEWENQLSARKTTPIRITFGVWWTKKIMVQEKNLKHTNNAFNKFYFYPNFFSYRFIPTFKKWCDSNKSRIIFSGKRLYNLTVSNFLKLTIYYQIQQFVYKNFVFESWFLMVSVIKEFVLKNWERLSCEDSYFWKN